VIKDVGRIRRRVAWLCKCDCGKDTTVASDHLFSGDTKSCGCYSRDITSLTNIKDLTNQKHGYLTVLRENGRTKRQQVKWLCECDCGKKTTVIGKNLLNGNTESCGCRRELNQRQGIAWEELVNKFLKFKYPNFEYHKQLPNLKRPDFYIIDKRIILDAKRHDYLKIDDCIEKYTPYCEKLVFICLERRRTESKKELEKNSMIEFWYPEDFLFWIPKETHAEFQEEVKKIKEMWINEHKQERNLNIHNAINRLEKKGKTIKQESVAKEMGTGRNIFKERPKLAEILKKYNKEKGEEIKAILLCLIEKMALKQLQIEKKATQLGVANLIYENHRKIVFNLLHKEKELPNKKNFTINLTSRINSTKLYRDKIDQVILEFNKKKKEKLITLIEIMLKERGKVSKYELWNNNRDIFNRSDVYKPEIDNLIKRKLKKVFKYSNNKKIETQDLKKYWI
jgi:hypothetical protein